MSKLSSLFSRGSAYRCAFCNTKLKKDELFCPNCGQPRVQEAPAYAEQPYNAAYDEPFDVPAMAEQPASGYVCAACGNPMEDGDLFCMNCGTRRADTPAAEPVYEEPDERISNPYMRPSAPEPVCESMQDASNPAETSVFMSAAEPVSEIQETPVPAMPAAAPVNEAAPVPEESVAAAEEPAPVQEAPAEEPAVCAPAEAASEALFEPESDVSADSSESSTLFGGIDEASIWGRPAEEPAPEVKTEAEAAADTYEPLPNDVPERPDDDGDDMSDEYADYDASADYGFSAETGEADDAEGDGEDASEADTAEEPAPAAPVSRHMADQSNMYGLKFLSDPARDVCILRSGAMIGRLASCSLVLDEPSVSRRHCHIDLADGEWRMVLLGVNGIVVDGEHYTNEYGRPVPLKDGCIIEFPGIHGNIIVEFMTNPF